MSSNRLVIFSKSSETGKVKTRLKSILSDDQCVSLHSALLKDTIFRMKKHQPVLYLSGNGYLSFDPKVPVFSQEGGDLGERLLNAFDQELKVHSKVIVIGTDSPTFPEEEFGNAINALENHDAVFGPCEDGGYYLIGLKRRIPEIFRQISWGSSTVLEETLQKMGHHSYQLLKKDYDIDTPADLERLRKEIKNLPDLPNLNEWIRETFGAE